MEGSRARRHPPPVESTADLLSRARDGDAPARDALFRRYLPILQTWAHGRLPLYARGPGDTDDLVQITLVRALARLDTFEPRREGAFLAYLRRILLNSMRDQLRRSRIAPEHAGELPPNLADQKPSLLEEAIGREAVERYEDALARLSPIQREAVILRVEFGWSHQEIASAIGCASANAARMRVTRSLARLAEIIDEERSA